MAEVMLKNKPPVQRITHYFNGDGAPASRAASDSIVSSAGPKKACRRGRPRKSAAAKTGKASSPSSIATQVQEPTSKKTTKNETSASSKTRREGEKGQEPQKPITDFFMVRRSDRRGMSSTEVKKAKEKEVEEKIKEGCEDGLKVVEFEGKGRGVVATKEFDRDDFVVEYAGELVSITTAKQREELYAKDERVGCYMYYFCHKNKHYCIDATEESGKLGRLLNHSRKGNCYTKVVAVGDTPYLVLLAAQHIEKGTELTYDYGDRSRTAIESHPWLKL